MPLTEFMRSWTNREYLVRLYWLDEQWNKPNRTDHYIMQVAQEVRRVLSKKPNSILLSMFKLVFSSGREKPDYKKLGAASKNTWMGFLKGFFNNQQKSKKPQPLKRETKP